VWLSPAKLAPAAGALDSVGCPGWLGDELSALGNHRGRRGSNSPDCPVCTGRQVDRAFNGQLCQKRKEIVHCSCPVVHRTVRCANGQKARIVYKMETQHLLAALGL
jgi:hypothetical protein